MMVEQLVPNIGTTRVKDCIESLSPPLEPFADSVLAFVAALSRAIFQDRDASQYPELQALAFWMRKTELLRLREEFAQLGTPDTLLVPRGLVFHIPPANVDTIFIYSWLLALLCGNRSIVRLSQRATPQVELLCGILRRVLAETEHELSASTVIVRYGHDVATTAAFSKCCDVRVIWGGDATVNRIREIPVNPHAKELTFADRSSLSVIQAIRYLETPAAERVRLAEQFFNDVFWFDQMACSSPRMLVWLGDIEVCKEASRQFFRELLICVDRKGHTTLPAAWIDKFTYACQAILDRPVTDYSGQQAVSTLHLAAMTTVPENHCGHGLLFEFFIEQLEDLRPYLRRRDQTLTYYGVDRVVLQHFVANLAGRAVDRLVPIGQALQFHRYWDGYDLLQEFTRRVYIA